MNRATIISVKDVTKIYREKHSRIESVALDHVTLNIEEGEFVALAGPSGSGKTTLLNLIGALDKPTGGQIIIDGTPLSTLNSSQAADFRLRKIGFIFQAYNLIETLTTEENAEYIALLQGMTPKQRKHETFHILKDLGLEAYLRRRPSQLSGGQQQRVATARAILVRPKIILADEPTANLDSKTGSALIDLMYAMSQNLNITFVFATHDKMVMDKAKTLIHLHDGRIVV
jgi:putative ABC transport system ATP-binding protein